MDLKIKTEKEEFHGRACGIIKQDDKFLIMRVNKTPYYHIPGGHIEIGEDSASTVKREVEEETGKRVEIIGYVATIENFFEMNGTKYHEIMFVHRVEFVDDEDKKIEYTLKNVEGKDYLQYEWLDLNNIEDYPLLPVAVKEILREGKFPVHWINDDLKA